MSDILTAISRGCKNTLVDGSVRYTIEFGPLEAVAAATLFGMPGTEMGVVALKDGRALNGGLGDEKVLATNKGAGLQARADHTEHILDMAETPATPMEIAQRDLVKYAGILSNDKQFWEWASEISSHEKSAEGAAEYIRERCGIGSRAHLAHDIDAAYIFRNIMREFDFWKSTK